MALAQVRAVLLEQVRVDLEARVEVLVERCPDDRDDDQCENHPLVVAGRIQRPIPHRIHPAVLVNRWIGEAAS